MIELTKYAKIKDKYCICYFGNSDEYLVQLDILKSFIEKKFNGINVFIGCKDDKTFIFENKDYIVKMSDLKDNRLNFGYIREIKFNGTTHPIEDLVNESELSDIAVAGNVLNYVSDKCVIISQAYYPTVSLTSAKVELLKKIAVQLGFNNIVIDEDITNSGLVMGVESFGLFQAAKNGIQTKLYPSGLGTNLYKSMFPNGEILKIQGT